MKKNYWSVYKNCMALWEFKFTNLDSQIVIELIKDFLTIGQKSKLFCAFLNENEVKIEELYPIIEKELNKKDSSQLGSFFERFQSNVGVSFYPYINIYDGDEKVREVRVDKKFRDFLKSISYEYLETNVFLDSLIKIKINFIQNDIYFTIELYSDIWLPKVNGYSNAENAIFDNFELAFYNSLNINILLNGMYFISEKFKGVSFYDEEGTNTKFNNYIQNGRFVF